MGISSFCTYGVGTKILWAGLFYHVSLIIDWQESYFVSFSLYKDKGDTLNRGNYRVEGVGAVVEGLIRQRVWIYEMQF